MPVTISELTTARDAAWACLDAIQTYVQAIYLASREIPYEVVRYGSPLESKVYIWPFFAATHQPLRDLREAGLRAQASKETMEAVKIATLGLFPAIPYEGVGPMHSCEIHTAFEGPAIIAWDLDQSYQLAAIDEDKNELRHLWDYAKKVQGTWRDVLHPLRLRIELEWAAAVRRLEARIQPIAVELVKGPQVTAVSATLQATIAKPTPADHQTTPSVLTLAPAATVASSDSIAPPSQGEAESSLADEDKPDSSQTVFIFRPKPNDTYEVGIGPQMLQFRGRGFRYIHEALARPDTHIEATELHGLGKGLPVGQDLKQSVGDGSGREDLASSGFGAEEPLSPEAILEIVKNLTALSNAADAAEATANGGKSREANDEIVKIILQCQRDGYEVKREEGKWQVKRQKIRGGKTIRRTVGTASGSSARSAVKMVIQDAIYKMREHFPELVAHLDDRLQTGSDVIYLSDKSVVWTLE